MFAKEFYLRDKTICGDLIDLFNQNKDQQIKGKIFNQLKGYCADPSVKDSVDFALNLTSPYAAVQKYLSELRIITEKYYKSFPSANAYGEWGMTTGFNIQYYKPGGGYKNWHTESACLHNCSRHLVWMTYLNDVWIGGGTKFKHQRKTIWARRGKTVIWPSDWTYTHKGQIAPFENKYIITGWYNWMT